MAMGLLGLMVLIVVWQWPDNRQLQINFCDVGQGDSSLVSLGNFQLLVDGGPDNKVLSCLGKVMPFWDKTIEMVVLTHPQADHMTGLIEVFERFKVQRFMASKAASPTAEYIALSQVVKEENCEVGEFLQGEAVKVGQLKLTVLWPKKGKEVKDVNELSSVIMGSFGELDFLLTGDIGEKEEKLIMDELKPVEILKVAHHGSKYSSSQVFLETVKPQVGVISVGKNYFGHPTEEVLGRLEAVGSKVLRTDQQGTVRIISDGKNWWLK